MDDAQKMWDKLDLFRAHPKRGYGLVQWTNSGRKQLPL